MILAIDPTPGPAELLGNEAGLRHAVYAAVPAHDPGEGPRIEQLTKRDAVAALHRY